MGNKVELKLDERTVHGKKVKQLRAQGITPVVIYGHSVTPVSAQVSHNVLEKAYRTAGTHSPVHLTIGSKKHIAMIKDVEMNAVKHTINHVAFHAVKATDPVVAEVPIHLTGEGESDAEKAGLIVLQSLEKIEVRALPMDLPDALEASILGLKEAGDKVLVSDIALPKNVELVDVVADPHAEDEETHSVTELVVANAYEPSALAAANEAAAGDADAEDAEEVAADNGEDAVEKADAA